MFRLFFLTLVTVSHFLLSNFSFAQSDAEPRTWTSTKGHTVEATFVNASGSMVQLKTEAGDTIELKRMDLSREDRRYLVEQKIKESKERMRARTGRRGAPEGNGFEFDDDDGL